MLEASRLAGWTSSIQESEIRRLLRFKPRFYLAGGLPGNQPLQVMQSIIRSIADELPKGVGQSTLLNYGPTEGIPELRQIIAERLKKEGIHISGDEVTITSGSQQALYGILMVLINTGDYVLVQQPAYLGFLGCVQTLGGNIITVA